MKRRKTRTLTEMDKNNDDSILRELAALNPVRTDELAGWPSSEDGRRNYERILAGRPMTRKSSSVGRWGHHRLVWVAAAFSLAAVALIAALVLVNSPSTQFAGVSTTLPGRPTSPSQTVTSAAAATTSPTRTVTTTASASTTSAAATPAAPLTVKEALSQIVTFVESTPTIGQGEQGPENKSLLEEAQIWGLVRSSEVATIKLDQPATRGEFALWLWRCFDRLLLQGAARAAASDLAGLTPEQQDAVTNLVRDGVIQLPADGAFHGDQVLTQAEASALLARVKALI